MADSESKKLFGMNKWDVEEAARNLEKAAELKESTPKLYDAAIKYLKRQQNSIGAILQAARRAKRTS